MVERAQQENYKIYPIQNPAQRVDQFIYDDGWKNLADNGAELKNGTEEKTEKNN